MRGHTVPPRGADSDDHSSDSSASDNEGDSDNKLEDEESQADRYYDQDQYSTDQYKISESIQKLSDLFAKQ